MADWPYNTGTWQRLRKAKLASDPLCYACGLRGRAVAAVAVDHVKAINAGGHPFPPLDGLMSMCERCHNEKTSAVDRGHLTAVPRRFKGFDANGNPIDPCDDWHGGGASNHGNGQRIGPSSSMNKYLVSNDLDEEGLA
ncbi:HNH endonuclease [Aquibium microcysteis]|uniref:HNH endonuclease n=1 Tax=Aquibium microcysteis TaxID=675281 RepID=UPI00165CF68B|nr:HNH endonuclease [Aquibium microcysteis]